MVRPINKFTIPFNYFLSLKSVGVLAGGYNSSFVFVSTIDSFNFATDTHSPAIGNLSVSKGNMAGTTNKSSIFVEGGAGSTNGSAVNTISEIPSATLINSVLLTTLNTARAWTFSASSSPTGFVFAGNNYSGSRSITSVEELSFSTKTNSLSSSTVTNRNSSGPNRNMQTLSHAYLVQGEVSGNGSDSSFTKYNLSTKTSVDSGTTGSGGVTSCGSMHNTNFGYQFVPPSTGRSGLKVAFATDTWSSMSNPTTYFQSCTLFNTLAGYQMGGEPSNPTASYAKMSFATETFSYSSLSSVKDSAVGQQNFY